MINFFPKPGMVLICDYTKGSIYPEMTKKRPVIVVSPYSINKRKLCIVVPLSTVTPDFIEFFHYKLPAGKYNFQDKRKDSWVKCNMISTVSIYRLDRIKHLRKFTAPLISSKDLKAIRECINLALI